MSGDLGNDTLKGDAGNDSLRGNDGNDVLMGAGGLDFMSGGSGKDGFAARDNLLDKLRGGTGIDRAFVDRGLDRKKSIENLLSGRQSFSSIKQCNFTFLESLRTIALGVSRQRVDEVLTRARHERAVGVGDVTD